MRARVPQPEPSPQHPRPVKSPETAAHAQLRRAQAVRERLALGLALRERARLPALLRLRLGWRLLALASVLPLLVACGAPATNAPGGAPGGAPAAADSRPADRPSAAAPVKLATAYTAASASFAPLVLAADTGLFAEEGIDASVIRVPPGQAMLGALTSGELPIVLAGAAQVVDANLSGGEYVLLGSIANVITNSIYVSPDIQRPEDLRGKSIGVSNFGAISHVAARVALDQWGLVEGRDVSVVRSGGTPETLAAMQSGAIAGGAFSPPQTFQAEELGFRELLDVSTTRYEVGIAAIVSTRRYAAEHPELVDRYFRVMAKAIQCFRDDPAAGVAAVAKQSQLEDRAMAERTWAWYRDKYTEDLALGEQVVMNNLRMIAEQRPEALQARPEQFLDPTFQQRFRASGYLEQARRGS